MIVNDNDIDHKEMITKKTIFVIMMITRMMIIRMVIMITMVITMKMIVEIAIVAIFKLIYS